MADNKEQYSPQDLVLHRGDMLLIDRIDQHGDGWLECSVLHEEPGAFADSAGRVPAWVGLEYMCQAIAAMEGIKRLEQQEPILISFIIGSKRVNSEVSHFYRYQALSVRVECEIRDTTSLGVFSCRIMDNNKLIMSAVIKGVMPEEADYILRGNHE